MSDEWLELTPEDIERAAQLDRAEQRSPSRAVMSEPIIIQPSDIPRDLPPAVSKGNIITVTQEDLVPVGSLAETTQDLQILEREMFRLINEARIAHVPGWIRTARLKDQRVLSAVARGHSADMLKRQYVAHVSPEGITAAQRIGKNGISFVACGENIGVYYGEGALTVQAILEIHEAFMNQPRSMTNHRGNLLNPIWTHVGIGIAHNPDGSLVATQNFISAPAARIRGR